MLSFTLERRLVTADALEVMIDVSETGDFVDPGNEGIKTVTIAANSSTSIHTVPTDSDDDALGPSLGRYGYTAAQRRLHGWRCRFCADRG